MITKALFKRLMNQKAHVLIATKGFRLHSSQKASIDLWYQTLLSSPEELAKWEEKLKKPTNKSGVKTLFFKNGNVRKENLYKFLKWYALDGELRKFQNQLKKGERERKRIVERVKAYKEFINMEWTEIEEKNDE